MVQYSTRTRSGQTRVIGGLSPNIELFGDWNKASAMLHALGPLMAMATMKGQKSVAHKLRKLIKKNIKAGGPPGTHWPPHSKGYSKYLGKKGGVKDSFYYQTGLYYKSITIHKTKASYHVGIKKGIMPSNKKSKITLGEIANVLERGSPLRNIKARPLWVPTWKQMKGNKGAKAIIMWHLRAELFKKFQVKARIY